mmetsp:Transcript_37288/g.107430  ORF Transcript_37288/g.107430 Transcript_37288/m.107430 type:complete len:100 (-) Transcript_37288:763-1062(-)
MEGRCNYCLVLKRIQTTCRVNKSASWPEQMESPTQKPQLLGVKAKAVTNRPTCPCMWVLAQRPIATAWNIAHDAIKEELLLCWLLLLLLLLLLLWARWI